MFADVGFSSFRFFGAGELEVREDLLEGDLLGLPPKRGGGEYRSRVWPLPLRGDL